MGSWVPGPSAFVAQDRAMSKPGLIPPPPRLYAIVARKSPWAVVFRRGPSKWFHIFRWDLESGALEDGVWLHDMVYPRRCDLSDDGRLLVFYMRATVGETNDVFAGFLSLPAFQVRLHWLEGDTWGRGFAVCAETGTPVDEWETCIHVDGCRMRIKPKESFFENERRRYWHESQEFPAPAPASPDRSSRWCLPESLVKRCVDGILLHLSDPGYLHSPRAIECRSPTYSLHLSDGQQLPLADAVWADFDHRSRLLTATSTGLLRIQTIESDGLSTIVEHDLRGMRPRPSPKIDWTQSTEVGYPS